MSPHCQFIAKYKEKIEMENSSEAVIVLVMEQCTHSVYALNK